MKQLTEDVVEWARAKGIFQKGTATSQWRKMHEEVGEVIEAINLDIIYGDRESVALEIGDVMVTCIILAHLYDFTAEGCLAAAYEKISGREGEMVNGQFVKAS